MKRFLLFIGVLGLVALPAWGQSFYESPDVPTDLAATTYLPWEIVRDDSGAYSLKLALPINTPLDALHQFCTGGWLLSVEAPTDLGGATYEQRDVIAFDGISYGLFFCGGPFGIPAGSDIDAALIRGGDNGDLVLSFDVPTDLSAIGGAVYDPADLVMFTRTGASCSSWSISGLYFDGSAAVPPVPPSGNVTGADSLGPLAVLTFDVPTNLSGTEYLPGELVAWNGAAFSWFYVPAAWPISSRVDALTFPPDPGSVPRIGPVGMRIGKVGAPSQIQLFWNASTSVGAEDYGIYEGNQGTWTSHTAIDCHDDLGDLTEVVTTGTGSHYYLVVPHNPIVEGSYGKNSWGGERPPGIVTCQPGQGLECP